MIRLHTWIGRLLSSLIVTCVIVIATSTSLAQASSKVVKAPKTRPAGAQAAKSIVKEKKTLSGTSDSSSKPAKQRIDSNQAGPEAAATFDSNNGQQSAVPQLSDVAASKNSEILPQTVTVEVPAWGIDPVMWLSLCIVAVILAYILGKRQGRSSQGVTPTVKNPVAGLNDSELAKLEAEIERLSDKNKHMEVQLRELEEQKRVTERKLNITIVRGNEDQQAGSGSVAPGSDTKVVAYLSTPDANGEFDDSQRSVTYRMGVSAFCIEYDGPDSQIARIRIADRPDATELLLRRREDMLEPVAVMQNAYRSDTVGIVVESPGEIELRGSRWRVRRKISARYI